MTDVKYLHLNIKGLMVIGIWPNVKFDSPIKNILYYIHGKIIVFLVIAFNITQILDMILVLNDLFLLIQNLMMTILYILTVLKIVVIHFRWRKIDSIFDRIRYEEIRAFGRSNTEKKIYFSSINLNRFMTKFFSYTVILTVCCFNTARPLEYWYNGPQEMYHYKIPFVSNSWYPFDKYNGNNFIIAYFLNSFLCALGAACISMSDTLYVGLIIFGIGQFKMIQQAIHDLHLTRDENGNMIKNKYKCLLDPFEETVDIIKHHNRIIEYYKELDEVMKQVMFLKFLTTSVMICTVGLEGILAGPSIRLLIDIEYLIALIIEVFLYYWFANELLLESVKVGSAVGDSKWYQFSPRVKKALLFLQMRCRKPSKLSIGGFFDVSLETFVVIMKSAYSIMTLLLNRYQNND